MEQQSTPPDSLVPEVNLEQTDPGRRYFWPVSAAGSLFCFSLLVWIAAGFGDPAAPVNRWINRYGTFVILGETVLVVLVSVLAMALDRQATLAAQDKRRSQTASTAESAADSQ